MKILLPVLFAFAFFHPLRAADEEAALADKLREALRNTMLQLRDAQGQIATLQAVDVENKRKLEDQDKKIDVLTKQAIADRNTSANMISDLNGKLDKEKATVAQLESTIAKWKKSYEEVTALAARKEFQRTELVDKVTKLDRRVFDAEIKNIQMYKLGIEVLDRYKKFGLGDALLAREPFIGATKVKFQNLVQDYKDKFLDQRIQPQDSQPPATKPNAPQQTSSQEKKP